MRSLLLRKRLKFVPRIKMMMDKKLKRLRKSVKGRQAIFIIIWLNMNLNFHSKKGFRWKNMKQILVLLMELKIFG